MHYMVKFVMWRKGGKIWDGDLVSLEVVASVLVSENKVNNPA